MFWALKSKWELKHHSDGHCGKENIRYESWCWNCISKVLEMQWNSGLGLWHVIPCLNLRCPLSHVHIVSKAVFSLSCCFVQEQVGEFLGNTGHSSLFLSLFMSQCFQSPLGSENSWSTAHCVKHKLATLPGHLQLLDKHCCCALELCMSVLCILWFSTVFNIHITHVI